MLEIERKYLVCKKLWQQVEKGKGKKIKQGYFVSNEKFSVRVRTKGEKAFLTIKGTQNEITRNEFEYEIPYQEAEFLLQHYASPYLDKTRYEITFEGKKWEVDEFHGRLTPLILAEIELDSEEEKFTLPNWIKEEVSTNPQYLNSNIIKSLYE